MNIHGIRLVIDQRINLRGRFLFFGAMSTLAWNYTSNIIHNTSRVNTIWVEHNDSIIVSKYLHKKLDNLIFYENSVNI